MTVSCLGSPGLDDATVNSATPTDVAAACCLKISAAQRLRKVYDSPVRQEGDDSMTRPQRLVGVVLLGAMVVLGLAESAIERGVAAQARGAAQAPRFEVDFAWPKPLPNHWVLGNAIGVWADERDHIWIVHR